VVTKSSDYNNKSQKLVISFSGDIVSAVDAEKLEKVLDKIEADKKAENASSNVGSTTSGTVSSTTSETTSSTTGSTTSSTTSETTSSTASSTTSSTTSSATTSTTEKQEENAETMVSVKSALTKVLTDAFKDNSIKLLDANTVNPTLAGSFFIKSLVAVVVAAALVVVYIGIRFRKIGGISASVCSLIALLHDVIIAFFVCVIFGLEIDTNFIAVILTLFGYSLNNTIVIFDRVRENRKFHRNLTVRECVNNSINETMGRSIMTTFTTFCAIIAIVVVAEFFGVTALRSFALPMAIGIVSGCFSSVFLAGPMWVFWKERTAKK
jgi:preprotein translocase subunit SecF